MIIPHGDRILVEPIVVKQVGSIMLPEGAEAPTECVVVALGTGSTNRKGVRSEFEVKVGDRIIMQRCRGVDVASGRRKFKILERSEVLAVIE